MFHYYTRNKKDGRHRKIEPADPYGPSPAPETHHLFWPTRRGLPHRGAQITNHAGEKSAQKRTTGPVVFLCHADPIPIPDEAY